MNSRPLRRPLRGLVPVVLVLAAACTDSPVEPGVNPVPEALLSLECRVSVSAQSMACSYPQDVLAGSAIRANRILGGQDKYVKLSNYGNTVQNDTFQTFVTVQNLLADPLGTTDGSTVDGVMVVFAEDPTNGVTVANATGDTMIIAPQQPYFRYPQILATYEVSAPLAWRFAVPGGVTSFSFKVHVVAPQADESQSLLDAVWTGAVSRDWFTPGNWSPATVPGATDVVNIPGTGTIDSLPVLTANAQAAALRVGTGRTLGLAGFNLAVGGNVDATGPVSGGTLTMSGTGARLNGTVPSLFVTGGVKLQGSTKAAGAVSVTGTLTVADSALSISIP